MCISVVSLCIGLEEVDAGMSVPSRGRMNSRPPLTQATFQSDRKSPSRSMSLSSSEFSQLFVHY